MMNLTEKMLKRDRLALARLTSKIENRDSDLAQLMKDIYPHTGHSQILGVTGPPGAGKSTLVDRMVKNLRAQGQRVAVVAVDPSSPFTGGALLGDRVRMQEHYQDDDVYIRSVGTRGKHGGLSLATKEVVLLLDAAGFDTVIVETAGVGQTELDILKLAQTVLVVLVPESGDAVQVMKAGLMEIADLFVVNKSDRPEADRLVRELTSLMGMSGPANPNNEPSEQWQVPILRTEALQNQGIESVCSSIQDHQTYLTRSGEREKKAWQFLEQEILDILIEKTGRRLENYLSHQQGKKLMEQLLTREYEPYEVSQQILNELDHSYES